MSLRQRLPGHALKGGEKKTPVDSEAVSEEIGFELGEWASSELARPLSGFQGLSRDLWIKKDDLQKMPDDDEELVSAPSSPSLESKGAEAKPLPPVEVARPSTQVSKGRSLRPRLEELRVKAAAAETAAPTGFFSWFRRRSTSAKDLPERDGWREHNVWMVRMAAPQAPEKGEIELDFDFRSPSQQSMGKARSKKSVGNDMSDTQGAVQSHVARKVTTQGSASQILHFTSQDFSLD